MSWLLNWLRVALLDLRGDVRHFGILIACLALGTCTIAAVGSVGAALQDAIVRDATVLMGGDLEVSRSDRRATPEERAFFETLGPTAEEDDSNGSATAGDNSAFLDIVGVDKDYPLVGSVNSPQLPKGRKPADLLALKDGAWGAIVNPIVLDRLGIKLGGKFNIGKTQYQARGILTSLPDGAARGFHLGLTTLISVEALAATCRFTNCLHDSEPGCAIKAALEAGTLDAGRLESYLKLQREVAAMARRENRIAERKQKKLEKKTNAAVEKREGRGWRKRYRR